MGNARGVRRDFVALEKRRFEAVKSFEKGVNNSEIGRRLEASNQTVSRWRKEYQENGKVALRRGGRCRENVHCPPPLTNEMSGSGAGGKSWAMWKPTNSRFQPRKWSG